MNNHDKFNERIPIYSALSGMGPLQHWPDRPARYTPERSHLLRFIVKHGAPTIREAIRLLRAARDAGFIVFDPDTRRWRGTGKVPKPHPASDRPFSARMRREHLRRLNLRSVPATPMPDDPKEATGARGAAAEVLTRTPVNQ